MLYIRTNVHALSIPKPYISNNFKGNATLCIRMHMSHQRDSSPGVLTQLYNLF